MDRKTLIIEQSSEVQVSAFIGFIYISLIDVDLLSIIIIVPLVQTICCDSLS